MSRSSSSTQNMARVGDTAGALPIFILLAALFVAVCWWTEPFRYHVFDMTVGVHPTVAQRAMFDDSERIVMLGCNEFDATQRAGLANRWLRARPQLERACVSDIYERTAER